MAMPKKMAKPKSGGQTKCISGRAKTANITLMCPIKHVTIYSRRYIQQVEQTTHGNLIRERTSNKPNPQVTLMPGFELGTHYWEARAIMHNGANLG